MQSREPTISARLKRRMPLWILAGGMLFDAGGLWAQRATDPANPQGKWEVLDRVKLVANAVMDGDSFRILHRGREYGVRLYFVDAPETDPTLQERAKDQATYFGILAKDIPRIGEQAARFTREKLSGREFTVQTRWQNAMGRSDVARFYGEVLVEGKNLGEELVAHGLARVYGPTAIRSDGTRAATVINKLKNLEITAHNERRGVWDETQFPRSASAAPELRQKPAAPQTVTPDSPLDLNTASFEDLQKLPGIGPKLAERIISHRPYTKVEGLAAVPGIGPKTLEKLSPLVRIGARK